MAYYLSNKDLLNEIKISKSKGEPTDKLVQMFILLSNHTSQRLKYRNPMDREDCIAAAIEDLVRYWYKFDETKYSNAFAYYTQIVKNAFVKSWYILGHKPNSPEIISISNLIL